MYGESYKARDLVWLIHRRLYALESHTLFFKEVPTKFIKVGEALGVDLEYYF